MPELTPTPLGLNNEAAGRDTITVYTWEPILTGYPLPVAS